MIAASDVTAIIVTRGDVDLVPILTSLVFKNRIVWNNSAPSYSDDGITVRPISIQGDFGAHGRYKAIESASTSLVYFQDDDCVVSESAQMALLLAYDEQHRAGIRFVSNMDPAHNGGQYPLLALPGWGSICDRSAPEDAFARWRAAHPDDYGSDDFLRIGCDIVFPVLTPSLMLDLGHDDLPYAHAKDRTWRREGYLERKAWYYRAAEALL